MSTYQVTGRLKFREHAPGQIFIARLDPVLERRAIARGNIKLLDRNTPTLQPGSYKLPDGWLTPKGGGTA